MIVSNNLVDHFIRYYFETFNFVTYLIFLYKILCSKYNDLAVSVPSCSDLIILINSGSFTCSAIHQELPDQGFKVTAETFGRESRERRSATKLVGPRIYLT